MARKCKYLGCKHTAGNCSMHRIPGDKATARRWLRLCGLGGTPSKLNVHAYVCSHHFPDGRPTEENPDPISFCLDQSFEPPGQIVTSTPLKPGCESPPLLPPRRSPQVYRKDVKRALHPNPWTARGAEVRKALKVEHNQTVMAHLKWSSGNAVSNSEAELLVPSFEDLSCSSVEPHVTSEVTCVTSDVNSLGETCPSVEDPSQLESPLLAAPLNSSMDRTCPSFQVPLRRRDPKKPCKHCGRSNAVVSYERCKNMNVKDFKFFTGVTQKQFEVVYALCGGDEVCSKLKYRYTKKTPKKAITSDFSPRDRLFMALIRLRRGIPMRDLSFVCGISVGFASECVYTWIRLISLTAQRFEAAMCVPAADQVKSKPKCFKPFPNLRMIIDCTEFKVETPSNFEQQGNMFSHYKKTSTVKVLVGISCYGGISFVSEAFEGSISDKRIVMNSGLMEVLSPNDAVMADRGFDMEAEFAAAGVELIIPPFLGGRDSFTSRELLLAKTISSGRIHVERGIRRFREFRILGRTIPSTLLPICGDMVRTIAFLINFQCPYIPGDPEDVEHSDMDLSF